MTVNERLSKAGLLLLWDQAVRGKNKAQLMDFLSQVELSDQAETITESALCPPQPVTFR